MCVTSTSAHEIGTTRIVATLGADGHYLVELSTDAASLLAKLEALADRLPSEGTTPGESVQRIGDLQAHFLDHVTIRFDHRIVSPKFECRLESTEDGDRGDALAMPLVRVRLSGEIPNGARIFNWSYGLTFASYALTVRGSGSEATEWLEGGQVSRPVALGERHADATPLQIATAYFALGFTHILPKGVDHILFVLGIFLFSRRLRPMLWQVTTFTLAHSITLGLTLYGVVSLSPSIVEPMIALSIAYVAVENLVTSELKPWRIALVFAFGLLHGMGFAGVLRELGLPHAQFLTGLVTFNAGVEAGQLTVIGGAFLGVACWFRNRDVYRRLVVIPGSALIALIGIYWTFQRLPLP